MTAVSLSVLQLGLASADEAPDLRAAQSPVSAKNQAGAVKTQTWRAAVGEDLVSVLTRWGRAAGFEVVLERGTNWQFTVPFEHPGPMKEAVADALAGFSTAAVAPVVTFYTNNVMTIGVR